jgi:hypothetical protein
MVYNFQRKHMTLGTTPAVKAGIADHVWSIEEVIGWKRGSKKRHDSNCTTTGHPERSVAIR